MIGLLGFMLLLGLCAMLWRSTSHVVPEKDTYDIDYHWNPLATVCEAAIMTGHHYDNIFLRDPNADLIDAEIMQLFDDEALARALEQEAVRTAVVVGPPFKPEEPQRLADYAGQPHITVPLAKAIAALAPTDRVIGHKLFTGLAGLGKTLIAKVVANELHLRAQQLGLPAVPFFWSFAANLNKTELLDNFVREIQAAGGGVWFIDEIHVLNDELQTKIYSLMEDGRYPYEGDANPTAIPDVMVIGATTDYGRLHAALKRRFGETLMLRRMSRENILTLIQKRSFPIQDGAAELLTDRTHWSGAPWEALVLRREAEIFARAAGRAMIIEQDVDEVFTTYGIDEQGLRWEDREVIRALFKRPRTRGKDQTFVCYGGSESDICAMSGLDPEEYREAVKPRLMSRGFLEVRAGYGQALTEQATTLYAALKP